MGTFIYHGYLKVPVAAGPKCNRGIAKLRDTFYRQLQDHYSSRKYKEHITLGCAERCLRNFKEDDLTRTENRCMHNCFHKYYRYLTYSNSLFTYMTADSET